RERDPPIFAEERLGLFEVRGLQDPCVVREEPASEATTEEVSDLVPQESCRNADEQDLPPRDPQRTREDRRRHDQRIARKEWKEHARLDEQHGEEADEHPRAE